MSEIDVIEVHFRRNSPRESAARDDSSVDGLNFIDRPLDEAKIVAAEIADRGQHCGQVGS